MKKMTVTLPEKVSRAVSPRDQEVQNCHSASDDSFYSPFFKYTLEVVKKSEDDRFSYLESEDGSNTTEYDASSNASNNSSQVSGTDSLDPCFDEMEVKGWASGGSVVTYEEVASNMGEIECERTGDRKLSRLEGPKLNYLDNAQYTCINDGLGMSESVGPAWTEDKHCSYLNSIEATFVQSLYGQDYCALDMPGQDDQDCVESRPMYPNSSCYVPGCELFTSLQRGRYYQREYYIPQFLPDFAPAVFSSPWIQHFKPRIMQIHGGASQEGGTDLGYVHLGCGRAFLTKDALEEVMESSPEFLEPIQSHSTWNSRFQSQQFTSTSSTGRANTGTQNKKHCCNLDTSSDDVFRSKKHKSMQQLLAEIDLKMEEQFVLKQANLKEQDTYIDLNESPPSVVEKSGGWDVSCKKDECYKNVTYQPPDIS